MKKYKALILISIFTLFAYVFTQQSKAGTLGLSLSPSSVEPGQSGSFTISLDTQGKDVSGVDALLTYDPDIIEVNSISFTEVLSFNHSQVDSTLGEISLTTTSLNPTESFKGTSTYATINFKGLANGQSTISFICAPGGTADTNIISTENFDDVVDCSSLGSATIIVSTATTGTGDQEDNTQEDNTSQDNSNQGNQNNTGGTNQDNTANSCDAPSIASNFTASPVDARSIRLTWNDNADASHYALQFGLNPGVYQWGVANIGKTSSFLVNFLNPNTTYYFSLHGVSGCGAANSGTLATARTLSAPASTTSSFDDDDFSSTEPLDELSPTFEEFDDFEEFDFTLEEFEIEAEPGLGNLSSQIAGTIPSQPNFIASRADGEEATADEDTGGIKSAPVIVAVLIVIIALAVATYLYMKNKGKNRPPKIINPPSSEGNYAFNRPAEVEKEAKPGVKATYPSPVQA